jgi:hypothetical protein
MMMVIKFEQVIVMPLAAIRDMLDAATLTRLAIADPSTVWKLVVATGNVPKHRGVRLNRRRTHPKCQRHAKHGTERPKARKERRSCVFHPAYLGL